MSELPTGTLTSLFTDIEGSTRLLHEVGVERYAAAEHWSTERGHSTAFGPLEVRIRGSLEQVRRSPAFATAWHEGSDMTLDRAVACGLDAARRVAERA